MYENVFKRVEEKYLLSSKQKQLLFEKISPHLKKDPFYESTVCNIYFDNKNHDIIINSLEKPPFKEKIRLRSYKVPNLEEEVFFEIKEKYKGIVGKRRIKMSLKDFYKYQKEHIPESENQILKEINYYFNYYHLEPSIFIAYDRKSYRSKDDDHLRITIDSNLRSRTEDLKLDLGDAGKKYFQEDMYIMEIKTLGALPLWLARSLSELKIYPTSFSKYGKIYEKNNQAKEELKYA